MATVVDEYTEVIRRLLAFETSYVGTERETLGYVAGGVASFLRRCPCGRHERMALLALADRAEEVSERCLESPYPTGKA